MTTNCEGSSSCYAVTGMRFRPLDEELISYLLTFVSGKPFECDHIRDNVDLYRNKKPCDIFDELSPEGETTNVNYFFTQLKRKSVNGKNFIRTMVGGGTWKGLDKGKNVLDKIKGSTIGLKKTLRYDDHNDEDQQYVWRMKEYCLSDKILTVLRKRGQIRHEDFVLCRIKRRQVEQKKGLLCHDIINSEAGFLCSNIPMEISSSGDHENIIVNLSERPMVGYCEEDQNQYVDSSIYCANYISEDHQFQLMVKDQGLCANNTSEQEKNTNAEDENIVVSEQLGCLEDQNYVLPTSRLQEGFCANTDISEDDHQFQQQEEEFERAKASVAPVEETLSALNNLLNGNEDFHSLLSTLLQTESDIDDPMGKMPHLISTDDQFSKQGTTMSSNGLPITSDQFQIGKHQNYDSSSGLVFSGGDECVFPMMDKIYKGDDLPCSNTQIYDPYSLQTQDPLSKQGDEEVNHINDIASYHKALDSYAASQLKCHPLSVPEATQLLDHTLKIIASDLWSF